MIQVPKINYLSEVRDPKKGEMVYVVDESCFFMWTGTEWKQVDKTNPPKFKPNKTTYMHLIEMLMEIIWVCAICVLSYMCLSSFFESVWGPAIGYLFCCVVLLELRKWYLKQ